MKFGGSSVANANRIKHVAKIIQQYKQQKPVVVLSAMGDTTDYLLEAADNAVKGKIQMKKITDLHQATIKELGISATEGATEIEGLLKELNTLLTGISMLKELTNRTKDYLVSFGERFSVRIMASYLTLEGVKARFCDAWDVGFVSDSQWTAAELKDCVWQNIPKAFEPYISGKDDSIPIVTGFIAKDTNGYITTLGRGGSDLSATMIGSALKAKEIQTWKDVDGIMSADPRIVSTAHPIEEVTYEEAAELAYFGAQVLHPRSMKPCIKTKTIVRVKNSYNIQSPGSIITQKHTATPPKVIAITCVKHTNLIDINSTRMLGAAGFLAHIFNQFLKWNISIDVIATSEVSVSLTVNDAKDLTGLIQDIGRVADVQVQKNKAIVTIICDAAHSSSILAKGFSALEKNNINVQMISQGASKVNISVLCDEGQAHQVVKILHSAFFGE